jgi:hypothetical protein
MMQNYYHQPKEGHSIGNFLYAAKLPKDILIIYEAGFACINPKVFPQWFALEIITSPDPFFPPLFRAYPKNTDLMFLFSR